MLNSDNVKLESIFTSNDEKVKCGEIFIRTSGIISLACGFCEEHDEFYAFETYSDHYFRSHFQKQQTTNIKLENKVQETSFGNQQNAEAASTLQDPLQSELRQDGIKDEYVHVISKTDLENSLTRDRIEQILQDCNNSGPEQPECSNSEPEKEDQSINELKCRKKKFICDQCNEVLTTKRTFTAHKWRVHLIGVACKLCEKQFATETSRKNHEKIHTGEPRKKDKYKRECYCKDPECPKHKYRRPTPKKPLSKCGHCDEVFVFKHDLRRHITILAINVNSVRSSSINIQIVKNTNAPTLGSVPTHVRTVRLRSVHRLIGRITSGYTRIIYLFFVRLVAIGLSPRPYSNTTHVISIRPIQILKRVTRVHYVECGLQNHTA